MSKTKSPLDEFSHYDLLFPSKYLKAGDLRGKEVTVVISEIEPRHELIGQGNRKDNKPLLRFVTPGGRAIEKGMVLNKTNGKRIMALYGPETRAWIGKPIILRAEKEPKSDSGEAIRVKQEAPKLKTAANGKQAQPASSEPRHNPDTGEVIDASSDEAGDLFGRTEPDVSEAEARSWAGDDEPGSRG